MRIIANRNSGDRFNGTSGNIVAKLDIEGGEYLVLPHLLLTGTLCSIRYIGVEFHPGGTMLRELVQSKLAQQACRTEVSIDDDKLYAFSSFPLP